MKYICTIAALSGTWVLTYLGLPFLGMEDRFAFPYSMVSVVVVAVFLVHFIQLKAPFVCEVRPSLKALAIGLVAAVGMAIIDYLLGAFFVTVGLESKPSPLDPLGYAKASGISFALTVLMGWFWLSLCVAGFLRSVLLGVFRVEP